MLGRAQCPPTGLMRKAFVSAGGDLLIRQAFACHLPRWGRLGLVRSTNECVAVMATYKMPPYSSPLPQKRVALNSRACSLVPVTGVVPLSKEMLFSLQPAGARQSPYVERRLHSSHLTIPISCAIIIIEYYADFEVKTWQSP